MNCPKCRKGDRIIKVGVRKLAKGPVQKYLCRRCGRYFSSSIHPFSLYPDELMIRSFNLYNRGLTVRDIISCMKEEYSVDIPERTVYSWLQRYNRRYHLYLLDHIKNGETMDPLRSVGYPMKDDQKMTYHRSKVESITCKDQSIMEFLDMIDPEFDMERARSHPNSRMGFEKFEQGELDWDRIDHYLIGLFKHIHDGMDMDALKEFLLVNHPDTIMHNVPYDLNVSGSSGCEVEVRMDLLARDGMGFKIFKIINNGNGITADSIDRMRPFIEIFKGVTDQRSVRLTLINSSAIKTVLI